MRILNFVFVILLSLISCSLFAQTEPLKKQIDLGIFQPSISAEFPLKGKFSIAAKAGLSTGFTGLAFGEGNFYYSIMPTYNLQTRYYYQGIKSATMSGRPLVGNSGMYFFLMAQGYLKPIIASYDTAEHDESFAVGVGWGIQRAYTNRFIWSFGLGYGFAKDGLTGVGELKLGINLFAD